MPSNLHILFAYIFKLTAFTQGILKLACGECVDKRLTIPLKGASVSLFKKQGPLRRQREQRHLKTKLRVSAIISRFFHVVCLEKYL